MYRFDFHSRSPRPYWLAAVLPDTPRENLKKYALADLDYLLSPTRYDGPYYKFHSRSVKTASKILAPYAGVWFPGNLMPLVDPWLAEQANGEFLICDSNTAEDCPEPNKWMYQVRFWHLEIAVEFKLRFFDTLTTPR